MLRGYLTNGLQIKSISLPVKERARRCHSGNERIPQVWGTWNWSSVQSCSRSQWASISHCQLPPK